MSSFVNWLITSSSPCKVTLTFFVTGGAGFIGSHTCVELLESGYDVVVIDNLSNACEESLKRVEKITGKTLKFYKGDIADKELMDKILTENDIYAVIHFAGLKAVGESVQALTLSSHMGLYTVP